MKGAMDIKNVKGRRLSHTQVNGKKKSFLKTYPKFLTSFTIATIVF